MNGCRLAVRLALGLLVVGCEKPPSGGHRPVVGPRERPTAPVVDRPPREVPGNPPAQFKAWGTRGPRLAPLGPGWTQAPAEPRARELPALSAEERARGFILFQRRVQEAVYHDTVPARHETEVRLRAFAAQGEYEPLTFSLHALGDLKGCRVTVGELRTSRGDVLPASHVDVRLVRSVRSRLSYKDKTDERYRLTPFLLERRERFDLPRGKTAQVWLTVKVPERARPGDYTGKVTVRAEAKSAAEIPILLRVLPFCLPPVPIETVMSYARPHKDPAVREKELIDHREHGINSSEVGVGAHVVSRDRSFGEDDVIATRERIREGLRLRRKVFGPSAYKRPVTAGVGFQIAYYWDREKDWFTFWPYSDELTADLFKAVRTVEDAVKKEGGPPLRIFVMDEPGGHPENLKHTVHYNRLVKKEFPHLRTWVTVGGGLSMGLDEIGLFAACIDEFNTNRFTPEICRRLLELGKTYGVYNGGGATEDIRGFARDRYFFGFYGWKTGARQILQWVYAFGRPWRDPIRGNHGYVYLADDGPLPSIPWESIREGVDDYRYTDLLWRLITVARRSGDAGAVAAAGAAEKTAREIMRSIDFGYQPVRGSASPAASASTMDKWRWMTASACLKLLDHVSLEEALRTPAERPGPFDLPFPGRKALALERGPELIPSGGFEKGPGPWKGSQNKDCKGGSGRIDAAERHGGRRSFRLESPGVAPGTAVNVCVWGWGGPGPSMTLRAGKTYEFSAWAKYAGAPPQIRVSLPKGTGEKEEVGEAEAEPSGWRRLYRRVTMRQDARPGYLAVWLQGPGTIWCDDLSLREIEVPPFALECDRFLLDDTDRLVAVRVSRRGGDEAISVRVTPPGSARARTVNVPPGGAAEVEFSAAELPLGRHELRAELVGGGADFGRTLTFRRIRGPFED